MMRNYTALPHEYLEEMQELSDAEYGRLVRALQKYSMSGEMEKLCGNERFYIKRVCNREDRYQSEFEESVKKRSSGGKKGAEKRWNGKNGSAIPDDSKNSIAIPDDSKNGSAIPDDSKNSIAISEHSKNSIAIFGNGKNGYTDTNTDTDTNTKADILSPPTSGGDNIGAGVRVVDMLHDPVVAPVMRYYMNRINPTPSQISIAELTDYAHSLGAEVCCHAMDVALDEKITAWSYIKGILRRYTEDGVRCLADIQAREQRHGKKREQKANKGFQTHSDELSESAKRAVMRALEEG